MTFSWQQRIAPQQQQPAQQPVVAPSNRPWWQPAPMVPQVQQPAPQPQQQALQQVQPGSVTPEGQSHIGDLLRQDGYHSEKAQSSKDTEPCPDCGSPNYMRSKESPNSMKQCFECGFNPRFAHSTAGASGIGQQNVAAPRPARVQNVATGAPPMGTVIGHI